MRDTNIKHISQILTGKHIGLVCGGGIAAIEMPRVARELRRHGATVQFIVTQECLNFIGMTSLEWASQNPVVLKPSGLSEHICTYDAILVAPATADLIASARYGLCQNGATTLLQSAFGMKVPIGFVPTMHDSMWNSPITQANYEYLKNIENVFFIHPRKEEHKEKIPAPKDLALTFAHFTNRLLHKGKKPVFVTLGGTRVMLDPVRFISNCSTGKLGWELATLFYGMGHDTTVFVGQTDFEVPQYQNLNIYHYKNYEDVYKFFSGFNFNHIHGFFHFLAASDYKPTLVSDKKLSSAQNTINIQFQNLKKIREIKNLQVIPYKFCCKLTSAYDVKTKACIKKMMQDLKVQSLLWNTPEDAWNNTSHKGMFVLRQNKRFSFESITEKKLIALKVYEEYCLAQRKD